MHFTIIDVVSWKAFKGVLSKEKQVRQKIKYRQMFGIYNREEKRKRHFKHL